MIINIILFIIDNMSLITVLILVAIILYSWISMLKNKDYKYMLNCNKRIKNSTLTERELDHVKEKIKNMKTKELELFSQWLFKSMGKYKSVILTSIENDQCRGLILLEVNNDTVFVECMKYDDQFTAAENCMIGQEMCQKLIGAMTVDNVRKGIIITTANVDGNLKSYINKLEEDTDLMIDILGLDDIMNLIQEINTVEVLNVIACVH
ncbi:restriction endonuclease [Inconstantimicrobium mannanitabidum]|uniref:Uncharacterized protein n=1 Tax=Inconstantimicrobium mannanitabidum TaxID=1604901 RepID=A0ACB5RAW4_9CLOT|nr:restriction endonuclease [Clostridium sp. TW13]GKX66169.1 hypothetical protein rsdtw13_14270 [Clostridium sp. TW13]